MFSPRQRKILRRLEDQHRVRVEDLAEQFATTPQTIRKDLQRLSQLPHVVRFHGGATLLSGVEYEALSARAAQASEEKAAIAEMAAGRLPDGCAVFVNSGTTTEQVARQLSGHTGMRVIVDNVDLAAKIRGYEGFEVIVPSGVVRGKDGAILGAEAVDYLRQFRCDYAVIGAAAVSEDGVLLDFDMSEVQVCRAMVSRARHVILTIDAGKFGRSAPVQLGHLEDVHTVITDANAPDWVDRLCAETEVELLRATPIAA